MRFFTRCKILYRVLMVFWIYTGIFLGLRWIQKIELNPWVICVFLILLLCLILLKCIIRDAEEDLAAIMKLKEESETHLGKPDAK